MQVAHDVDHEFTEHQALSCCFDTSHRPTFSQMSAPAAIVKRALPPAGAQNNYPPRWDGKSLTWQGTLIRRSTLRPELAQPVLAGLDQIPFPLHDLRCNQPPNEE